MPTVITQHHDLHGVGSDKMKTEIESNGCNPKAAYHGRAQTHPHPVAKRLFEIAETKKSNLIISADFRTTAEMLKCAYDIGPYIAVFKTHIDMISDFSDLTINGLRAIARTHNFLIFEDRKFVDIGHTVIGQYHGGALRISEWADIVNLSILGGEGIVDALDQTIRHPSFPFQGQRALLLLAEMTSQGSLAGGEYTERCVEMAARYPESVIGFVATKALTTVGEGADFVTFTTGVNRSAEGDELGQQYQTPRSAVLGGSDFIIAGRGILGATSPVAEAIRYRREGWEAYLDRTGQR